MSVTEMLKRRLKMEKATSGNSLAANSFKIESLEPRILFSGDGVPTSEGEAWSSSFSEVQEQVQQFVTENDVALPYIKLADAV